MTSEGLGPREVIIDNGATEVVLGKDTYDAWAKSESKSGDTRKPVASASNKLFRFGDNRTKRALFQGRLPTTVGGFRGGLHGHVVPGGLGTLFADPALGAWRALLDYRRFPEEGKPQVSVKVPGGGCRARVPVRRSAAGHWVMDLDTTRDEVEFLTAEQEDALLTEEAPEPPACGLEKDGAVDPARSSAADGPPENSSLFPEPWAS